MADYIPMPPRVPVGSPLLMPENVLGLPMGEQLIDYNPDPISLESPPEVIQAPMLTPQAPQGAILPRQQGLFVPQPPQTIGGRINEYVDQRGGALNTITNALGALEEQYIQSQLTPDQFLTRQNQKSAQEIAKQKMDIDRYQWTQDLAFKEKELEAKKVELANQTALLGAQLAGQNIQNMIGMASLGYRTNPMTGEQTYSPPRPKLSATEQKEFYDAKGIYDSSDSAAKAIDDALRLNDSSMSGFGAAPRAAIASNIANVFGAETPEADNTVMMQNIIKEQALSSLKATFGANPTEGERQILLELQASVDKTPSQRRAILERAKAMAENKKALSQSVMGGITTGDIYSNPILGSPSIPQGIDPAEWEAMTPEERVLFQ